MRQYLTVEEARNLHSVGVHVKHTAPQRDDECACGDSVMLLSDYELSADIRRGIRIYIEIEEGTE